VRAGLFVAPGTLTPALSPRERERGFAFRCGVAPLAGIPDRERRDGGPERVIRRTHPVVAMAVLPWRGHEIGHSLECEGGPGAGAQEVREALKVARHVAIQKADADARVDGEAAVLPGEHVGRGLGVERVSFGKTSARASCGRAR
jgi:hypothetical protein